MDTESSTLQESLHYIIWKKSEGAIHRDGDKPAIITDSGSVEWRSHNLLNREQKPASITLHGEMTSYRNGKLHAEGGRPAEIKTDGSAEWRYEGKRHRIGGPAVTPKNIYAICGFTLKNSDSYNLVIEKLGGEKLLRGMPYSYIKKLIEATVEDSPTLFKAERKALWVE